VNKLVGSILRRLDWTNSNVSEWFSVSYLTINEVSDFVAIIMD